MIKRHIQNLNLNINNVNVRFSAVDVRQSEMQLNYRETERCENICTSYYFTEYCLKHMMHICFFLFSYLKCFNLHAGTSDSDTGMWLLCEKMLKLVSHSSLSSSHPPLFSVTIFHR